MPASEWRTICSFLASDRAAAITGVENLIDGGMVKATQGNEGMLCSGQVMGALRTRAGGWPCWQDAEEGDHVDEPQGPLR